MRIVQIIPRFCLAGAETMCCLLSLALQKRGHEVTAISLYDYHSALTERLEAAGVRVICLHKKLGIDLRMLPRIRHVLRMYKPDVIHTHLSTLLYALPASAFMRRKYRVIYTVHNLAHMDGKRRLRRLFRLFFHLNQAIPVALTKMIRSSIIEEYHFPEHAIPVVFNGIDFSRCIAVTNYNAHQPFIFLHIGRFTEVKNHMLLLEAFALVHAQWPDTRLKLVGDGKLMPAVRARVIEMGLKESVIFAGLLDNVYPELAQADAFVLPSAFEGMPMTLLEAMGTGLPIVATAVGGVPDMLRDGENALLTDVSARSVADAMLRLRDASLREKLGVNARREALARFSAERMAEGYEALYEWR